MPRGVRDARRFPAMTAHASTLHRLHIRPARNTGCRVELRRKLRHPLENPTYVACLVVSMTILAVAIWLVVFGAGWLAFHPMIAKHTDKIRAALIALMAAPPALVLSRHAHLRIVESNAIRITDRQFPELYAILVDQCRRIGREDIPELYISTGLDEVTTAHSIFTGRCCIVLSSELATREYQELLDAFAYLIGWSLGRLELGHCNWTRQLLISYVLFTSWGKAPLRKACTRSCDRYAAYLEPEGVRGLLIQACGRELLSSLDFKAYVEHALHVPVMRARIANMKKQQPPLVLRVSELYQAKLFDLDRDLKRLSPPPDDD
ncbi:Putative peptidase A [Labilithrix luteola]|uniref:Putative peptidase A n=1 Tax=Labilithrix luteola TaxID=1391654 RepID=A0A0K1PZS0_9BACT|nr:Putative peptidase A [Labilithrix luteola]